MSYVKQIIETIQDTGGIRPGSFNVTPLLLKGSVGIYERDGNKTAVLVEHKGTTVSLRPLVINDGVVCVIDVSCGKEFPLKEGEDIHQAYKRASSSDSLTEITSFNLFAM